MIKIYCNKETDVVEQIYDYSIHYDIWDTLTENTFDYFYLVEINSPINIDYSYIYNKGKKEFFKNPHYVEPNSEVLPNPYEEVLKQISLIQTNTFSNTSLEEIKKDIDDIRNEISILKELMGRITLIQQQPS